MNNSADQIEYLGKSLIQHGKNSDRVYLMKYNESDRSQIITEIERLAQQHGYSKIFAKIPDHVMDDFLLDGYSIEARVPGYCHGKVNYSFLAKYLVKERANLNNPHLIKEVLEASAKKAGSTFKEKLPDPFRIRHLERTDLIKAAKLYQEVFESYPFPIHDPEYLEETMQDNILYFGAFDNDRLVAAASCEMDMDCSNSEMTDFAVHPKAQGKGLSCHLLTAMEHEMRKRNYPTLYTIARAESFGMNMTFSKLGYCFGGTLINNTQISGHLESMNVWYKGYTL